MSVAVFASVALVEYQKFTIFFESMPPDLPSVAYLTHVHMLCMITNNLLTGEWFLPIGLNLAHNEFNDALHLFPC